MLNVDFWLSDYSVVYKLIGQNWEVDYKTITDELNELIIRCTGGFYD